jgi:hypothetical protein
MLLTGQGTAHIETVYSFRKYFSDNFKYPNTDDPFRVNLKFIDSPDFFQTAFYAASFVYGTYYG